MAVLKDHMLIEIAVDLCERAHPVVPMLVIETLPGVENFMLSGKGPFRVFLRLVIDEFYINSVTSDTVRMECTYTPWPITRQLPTSYQWQLKSVFLNTLFINWIKKLKMGAFEWLVAFPRTGYCEMLAQNSGIFELFIDNDRFHDWDTILKAFPEVRYLAVLGNNFASLLYSAPNELDLRHVVLIIKDDNSVLQATQALSKHQNKCPKLGAVAYVTDSLEQIKFSDIDAPILSIKCVQVTLTKIKCCNPFDFSFLTPAQKMFPSLKLVYFHAVAKCKCKPTDRLKVIDALYESFESYNFGIPITLQYNNAFNCYEKDVHKLHQFFGTKGTVFGRRNKFAVKTSVPGKSLTYQVRIKIYKNPRL